MLSFLFKTAPLKPPFNETLHFINKIAVGINFSFWQLAKVTCMWNEAVQTSLETDSYFHAVVVVLLRGHSGSTAGPDAGPQTYKVRALQPESCPSP